MKQTVIFIVLIFTLLACRQGNLPQIGSNPQPTVTLVVAKFTRPTTTVVSPTLTPTPAPTLTPTKKVLDTPTPSLNVGPPTGAIASSSPTLSATPMPLIPTPVPETVSPTSVSPPAETASEDRVDFVFRWARMRTNEENSWDGTLGPGKCGSDHSIYVYVGDAQENLLNGILIGDKYGNFEVPTGVDGPGMVRILVWSATMELSVVGYENGTRYTSDFSPPLSTLDEHIPLDWLQQAGYCDSPEDCRWRVENNQLCRGHYSYVVAFQRSW